MASTVFLKLKDEVDLKELILQLFSFDAQTVIDADPMNGLSITDSTN